MSGRAFRTILTASAVAALSGVAMPDIARAEFVLGAYGGWNGSLNSDVTFTGPGTNWTLQDVPWLGLSFSQDGAAPYYGARVTYWPESMPQWGFMLDYTHAKVRANPNATVNTSGTGGPVGSATIGSMFSVLELTDGISLLTLNGLYRFEPMGRFQPYVGAGIGINIPHVEVTKIGGAPALPTTFQYAFGGAAVQALAGVDIRLTKHWSAFAEYKLSWAGVNAPLASGGYRMHTNLITNHIIGGVSLHFGGN